MIPKPGDANHEVTIEADDQAIQTILLSLLEDIYAAVDSCETAQEIWLREKKAKLFNEWERFASNEGESIESYYHRFLKLMNDLKEINTFQKRLPAISTDYTQLYDFLKYNKKEVDELKVERLAKIQDPLVLLANSNNPYAFPAPHQDQPSFNQNYMQQPMSNLEDITDPTTAMNMNQGVQNAVQNPRVQNIGNQNGLIADLDEIEEVNANCILMANLQKTSTSEEQYTKLLEPIPESHQVPQNDNNVISKVTSVEQGGETVEQHPANFEETRMFRINPFKTSREEKHMPNNISASARTKPITISQPSVITKKDVNSDSNGFPSTGIIQICLWCIDSGCSKHMTGNLKLLINFAWKFMGTVRFENDHVAAILGFGQFCDSNLEVAFRRNACFVRNLDRVDLLKGDRSTNLYTINLHEMASASPICLMARASSTKSGYDINGYPTSTLTP
nr:integrase, catalytic region, zinc finger, CCHC-type, peptidase aspartic, catalytic [Tanacetum cinerariifolium]